MLLMFPGFLIVVAYKSNATVTRKKQLKSGNTFAVFCVFICDFYVSLWRWTSMLQRSKTRWHQ